MQKGLILVVDDVADQRTIAAALLQYEGYGVLEADSIAVAESVIERTQPDLILLDLNMPGRTGLHWLRDFTTADRERLPPIVAYTSFGDIYNHELRTLGVTAVIDKAASPTRFLAVIAASLPPLSERSDQRASQV